MWSLRGSQAGSVERIEHALRRAEELEYDVAEAIEAEAFQLLDLLSVADA